MGGKKILLTAALAVTAGLLFFAGPSEAVHKGAGGLTCGQCHTMHNSQGRAELIYNTDPTTAIASQGKPSMILLRGRVTGREKIHNLCLQCHGEGGAMASVVQNGSGITPPKVYLANSPWREGNSFNSIGAGGDFSSTGSWTGSEFILTEKDGATTCDNGMASRGKGHSLGCTGVVPPGADSEIGLDLSCTSCHDPHGTALAPGNGAGEDPYINRYRNLRYNPVGGGGGTAPDTGLDGSGGETKVFVYGSSYVGGVTGLSDVSGGTGNYAGVVITGSVTLDGSDPTIRTYSPGDSDSAHVWPVWVGNYSANADIDQNTYNAPANASTGQNEGIGPWCAQCHDRWHEASTQGKSDQNLYTDGQKTDIDCATDGSTIGIDWKRHPVDNPIIGDGTPCSTGGVEIIRYTNYQSIPLGKQLPAANTSGVTGNEKYFANDQSDKVFCLSCHFVHGGPYNDNLRWDYTQDDSDPPVMDKDGNMVSGIQRGWQVGKAIATNIGCQQCHNR